MAYTPTVWATGDVITAEKLNKAENGIAGAYPIVYQMSEWVTDADTGEKITSADVDYETVRSGLADGKQYCFLVPELADIGSAFPLHLIGMTSGLDPYTIPLYSELLEMHYTITEGDDGKFCVVYSVEG